LKAVLFSDAWAGSFAVGRCDPGVGKGLEGGLLLVNIITMECRLSLLLAAQTSNVCSAIY
jgi:hypothetical protein